MATLDEIIVATSCCDNSCPSVFITWFLLVTASNFLPSGTLRFCRKSTPNKKLTFSAQTQHYRAENSKQRTWRQRWTIQSAFYVPLWSDICLCLSLNLRAHPHPQLCLLLQLALLLNSLARSLPIPQNALPASHFGLCSWLAGVRCWLIAVIIYHGLHKADVYSEKSKKTQPNILSLNFRWLLAGVGCGFLIIF